MEDASDKKCAKLENSQKYCAAFVQRKQTTKLWRADHQKETICDILKINIYL